MPLQRILFVMLLMAQSAHASFFVDSPDKSIDEKMRDCFSDAQCALQAQVLVPVFARQRAMDALEVRQKLNNCLNPDHNMSFCASYELFALRYELRGMIQQYLQKNPGNAVARQVPDLDTWQLRASKICAGKIRKTMPDASGLFRSELVIACEIKATKSMVLHLNAQSLHHKP
ncbi:hypothetical protein ACO0LM_17970 [Undibacterium sp. Di26W]|uniref:hypothetical protein n=1 Tax=Undibacterium sp. Di26W TaxID=3413035 RepID=UPI003BF3EE3D